MAAALPANIYSIKFNDRYFGFNDRAKHPRSVVLTFADRDSAVLIRQRLSSIGTFPRIYFNNKNEFVMSKRKPRKNPNPNKEMTIFSPTDLVVCEHETELFIYKLGINEVDTCIVNGMDETNKVVTIREYYVVQLKDTAEWDNIIDNLVGIYSIEPAPLLPPDSTDAPDSAE